MRTRPRSYSSLLGLAAIVLIGGAVLARAAQLPATLQIEGLGRGMVELGGPWQFHLGDDLHWAQPEVNDATGQNGWETILPDRPWGAQRHYAYAGFAWYRLHLHITTAPGLKSSIQVLLPQVSDVCDVYWNGSLIGHFGTLPPHASWPAVSVPTAFTLNGSLDGTLALRVWKGPLGSSSPGEIGGLGATPLVGDADSIRRSMGDWEHDFLLATLYQDVLDVLYFAVALAAFLLWLRRRGEMPLLWFSIFAVCPAIWTSIFTMRMPVSSALGVFIVQMLWQLRNVALWFLLIDMLDLRDRRGLLRWARILAVISLTAAFFDGCLNYIPESLLSVHAGAWIDGILTVIVEPSDLYLLVLAGFGFRKKLDLARSIVALSASLSQLLSVATATAQQGQRFTHWTLAQKLYSPLFHLGPVYFTAQMLVDLVLFLSILYAVYSYVRDQQARKTSLEQELESARELQAVLIPEKPPSIPGFTITSAYHPALEVGGDFFQIIPLEGKFSGSTLIVLGDVSGNGLRAAMAVSLIVGAVRTLAEVTSSPAEILAGLSRRLHGRLQGGFATCLALRLDPGGVFHIASAGHPPPYLNGRECNLPGALPLGIDPAARYEEFQIEIQTGDRCALYTDGLLEARTASGEIFSFERLRELFASGADAARASEAAVHFGQEDDITVLTVTRTGEA